MLLEVRHVMVTRRCVDGIPILDLAGRFVLWTDPDASSLRAPVAKLVSEGRSHVLVHLAQVIDIDAHGLGELAWGFSTLCQSGGQMALIAPSLRVRRLLELTKLDTALAIYDSECDAINGSLAKDVTSAASVSGLTPRRLGGGAAYTLSTRTAIP